MDFKLTYWTRRWSANTTLTVQKFEAGWHISHVTIYSDADREGAPFLGMRTAKSSTQPCKAKTWCALTFKWAPVLAF